MMDTPTRIQLEERAKRRRNSVRGMTQLKGTVPYVFKPTGKPWFKPMTRLPLPRFDIRDLRGLMDRIAPLLSIPKFWKRRRKGFDENTARVRGKVTV